MNASRKNRWTLRLPALLLAAFFAFAGGLGGALNVRIGEVDQPVEMTELLILRSAGQRVATAHTSVTRRSHAHAERPTLSVPGLSPSVGHRIAAHFRSNSNLQNGIGRPLNL